MSLWNRITTYLSDAQNLRKVILIFIGIIFLGGVVLFNSDIQQLLRSPWPSRADGAGPPEGSDEIWATLPASLSAERSNAKLIDVTDANGVRWLYTIGGINTVPDGLPRPPWSPPTDGLRLNLMNEVERIQLTADGAVDLSAPQPGWNAVAPMNFGHAEFGLLEFKDYLYVISGDIHMPIVEDPATDSPLLYSTIERLPLANLDATTEWEIFALVSGVNFYPEVAVFEDKIHIVGGVFGNPFRNTAFNVFGGNSAKDPIILEDDYNNWGEFNLGDKPVIGGTPIIIPNSGGNIGGFGTESLDEGVTIQQYNPGDPYAPPWDYRWWFDPDDPWWENPWANLSYSWSELLLHGEFVTTVSEHYIVDIDSNGNYNAAGSRFGELGVDYIADEELYEPPLDDLWRTRNLDLIYNQVFKIGHVRILLTGLDYCGLQFPVIEPPPQGRYGHKLIVHNNDADLIQDDLLVVGGASWSNPLALLGYLNCDGGGAISGNVDFTFWVNDDSVSPLFWLSSYFGGYEYVGNITYKWTKSSGVLEWEGTNAEVASFTNTGADTANLKLEDFYALKIPGGSHQGRAFFGLAKMDTSGANAAFSKNEFVVTGGLVNDGDLIEDFNLLYPGWVRFRYMPIAITSRAEKLENLNFGWNPINDWGGDTYNLSSIGIDNYRSIYFNGQTDFRDGSPSYGRGLDNHVPDFVMGVNPITEMLDSYGDEWYAMPSGINSLAFSAVHDVRTTNQDGINTVYIYKAGGSSGYTNIWLPTPNGGVQVLGPFFYGEPGEVNPGNSTFTVEPQEVAGDNTAYAIATVTLKDYNYDPIVNKHVKAANNNAVLPPDDPLRVETFSATEGGMGVPRDDLIFSYPYLRTDANGSAQFKLYYKGDIADLPYDLGVLILHAADDGTPEGPPLGPRPLSFIKDGVPFDTESTITAVPYKVAVDGVSTSTITLTLRDGNGLPVPDYRVDVTSDRNDGPVTVDVIVPDPLYEDPENPGEYITDSNGEVLFYISSSVKGIARIHGSYKYPTVPDTWIELSSYASVKFAGYIEGLFPSEGTQGIDLAWMTIQGAQTEWNEPSTIVEFIEPDDVSFYQPLAGGEIGDIEDVRFVADGHSSTVLGVYNRNFADSNITITLDDGDGILRKDSVQGDTINTQLDAEGKVLFEYIAGVTPMIVKIRATISSGNNPSADMWFIQEPAAPNPWHLEIYADPLSLGNADPTSLISARIYRMINGQKMDIEEAGIPFEFTVDDAEGGGFMDPTNMNTDTDGIVRSTYSKSTEPGKARVFVSAMYQGLYIAEKIILRKLPSIASPISPDSTVINSTELITLGGDIDNDPTGVEFVRIAVDAKVGIWTVRVTTSNIAGPGTSFEDAPVVEEHPFVVLPAGVISGPELDIEPKQGLRGTDEMTVAIYGTDTLFFGYGATVITFNPVGGIGQAGIEVLATRIFGSESAEVGIKINFDAPVGWWDVIATTDLGGGNIQIAMTPPENRFWVTDDNGYEVSVYSNRYEIPRDGESQATITVFVGEPDPLTGEVIPLNNVDVVMTIDDDGTIFPVEITTNEDGLAYTTYTVDIGDENDEVRITATAEPEPGIFSQGSTVLYKVVNPYAGFILEANPTVLPLQGTAISALTAEGLPTGTDIPVTFHFANNSRGNLEPINVNTTTGMATSSYIAAPEGSRIPEVVEIYASAVVADYGRIMSNKVAIQIGFDESKYDLALVANPSEVLAGGDERATLTAALTWQYSPVSDWPIIFEIVNPGAGDYLTQLTVRTASSSGEAETEFVPGNIAGPIIVRAHPVGLNIFEEIVITKGFDPDVDPDLSTISAVPRYVPTSDGEDFSVVTVTLRNVNYVPLPGIQVTLTTDRIADEIRLADGTLNHVTNTDYRGRAIFRVSSTQTGMSAITGTLSDGFELGTEIIFEAPGSLIWHNLKVIVPFEARDYDNEVWLYLTEDDSVNPVFINEVYRKNPRPDNYVQELYEIKIYLHTNSTYTMWAKGRYHKAKIVAPITTGSIGGSDLPIEFDELLIGDLEPASSALHKRSAPYEDEDLPTPYHDNFVNTIDLPPIYNSWFANSYLADFFRDFIVNSIDFNYWVSNYGPGVDGNGPPPLYD